MDIKELKNKGFTLIELLVVISIIALISTIVLGSLNQARAKSRDTSLLRSVDELQNALELYKLDNGGNYPGEPGTGFWFSINKNGSGVVTTSGTGVDLEDALVPDYIAQLPEPTSNSTSIQYYQDDEYACVGSGFTEDRYEIYIQPETNSLDFIPGYYWIDDYPTVWTDWLCIAAPK